MFHLGSMGELLIIVFAALVLLGPKDMPRMLHFLGRMIQKVRTFSKAVQGHVDTLVHNAQVEDFAERMRAQVMEPKPKKTPAKKTTASSKKKTVKRVKKMVSPHE